MKYLVLILILIFIGCKNESKTKTQNQSETITEVESENGLDKSVSEMWNNYIESNPEFKDDEIPASDFFHNNREDANRLAKLTLKGKKKLLRGYLVYINNMKLIYPK